VCRLDWIRIIDELFVELYRRTSTKMSKHPPLNTCSGTFYPSRTGILLSGG
jgi:hypothetical protein